MENYISGLKKVIRELLEEHGGFAERNYLLSLLVGFSADCGRAGEEEKKLHKNHLDFLISRLLRDEFEEASESKHFKETIKFKHQTLDHLEEIAEELLSKIKEAKKVFCTSEIVL